MVRHPRHRHRRVPLDAHPEYGTDEHGLRTVTLGLFMLDDTGRKIVDETCEVDDEGRPLPGQHVFLRERVTVADEPPSGHDHSEHVHAALSGGRP